MQFFSGDATILKKKNAPQKHKKMPWFEKEPFSFCSAAVNMDILGERKLRIFVAMSTFYSI